MQSILTAVEARQKFGEILDRVNDVHDQFIIERNGKPLAAIVPIDLLEELKTISSKRVAKFLASGGSNLSDDEAMDIANEAIVEVRRARKKRTK